MAINSALAWLWFSAIKTVSMKKTLFVLPFCIFLAFCSSSRKAATPAPSGISNVNVSRGDTMTSAAKAGAGFTPAERDWAYKANRDTSLNGTWTLDGMLASNGSWNSTSNWNQDTTATAATTTETGSMTTASGGISNASGNSNAAKRTRTRASGRNNRRALYDTAKARLNLDYKSTATLDTTVQPFQYWKRVPTLTLNAARQVFTGTTGCNRDRKSVV